MTLKQYLLPLRRQWMVILLITIATLGAVTAYTLTRTQLYSATSELFVSVSQTQDGDVGALQQGSTLAQAKVITYSQIVTVNDVLQPVINELSLPYTVQQLRGAVSVSTPVNTVLMDIKVLDPSGERAAAIANAIAVQLPKIVADLETPIGQTVSPVKVSTLQQAAPSAHPVSPKIKINLAIGLFLGIGLGILGAYARDQLNTPIRSPEEVEAITGAVPLGSTPLDRTADAQPLAQGEESGGRAEAYRSLRTNLQYTNVDHPPRVVVVTSSVPNEGKSTTACNLAMTLVMDGSTAALVGGDLRQPSVSSYLGISGAVGLTNVLAGQYALHEALVPMMRGRLAVLPSGPTPPNPAELLHSDHMAALIHTLEEKFDYVIIDAPPVLSVTDAAVLAALSDGALVVVKHGQTTGDQLKETMQSLELVRARVLGTVLNFVPAKRGRKSAGYGYVYGKNDAKKSNLGGTEWLVGGPGSSNGRPSKNAQPPQHTRSAAALHQPAEAEPASGKGPSAELSTELKAELRSMSAFEPGGPSKPAGSGTGAKPAAPDRGQNGRSPERKPS